MRAARRSGCSGRGAIEQPSTIPLDRLIERIYDAGVVEEAWADVMPAVVRHCGARSAVVLINDDATGRLTFADEVGLAADYRRAYLADLRRDDLRLDDLVRHPVGTVRTDTMIPRYAAYRKSRAYRELYRKLGTEHALGAFLYRDSGRTVGLRVFRSSRDGPFGADDVERYQALLPHLARAFRLRALNRAHHRAAARPQQALDLLAWPVFLIEPHSPARALNRAAQALADARGAALSSALSQAAARAVATWREDGQTAFVRLAPDPAADGVGGVLSLELIAPAADDPDAAPTAVAVLARPADADARSADALAALFHLTPAERSLAAALSAGCRLSTAAEQLSITYETARSHLRSIFAKTGVDRQTDLVRLALAQPTIGGRRAVAPRRLPDPSG
ncbi:MAG: helix-turn-helix transcriptional regulator [Alphaproteobacteria bacterium]|nr:helix-turn-helix transcriptional regulator [Alphaproteobacteria bacterium]